MNSRVLFTLLVYRDRLGWWNVEQVNWDGSHHLLFRCLTWDELEDHGYVSPDALEWLV